MFRLCSYSNFQLLPIVVSEQSAGADNSGRGGGLGVRSISETSYRGPRC